MSIYLGIIGTGGMANAHAEQFKAIRGCKIIAACDIDPVRVKTYSEKHAIPRKYTDVDKLLADKQVDAVSIVTPDGFHAPLSIAALKAGKHVLCEKPLATSYSDAQKMVRAAKRAGVINMVNFSYRGSAAIHRAVRMIAQGKLGNIRHVHAHYLQSWLVQDFWGDWKTTPAWLWRCSSRHGSKGVLGDIGVHILDFATYPVGPVKKIHCKLQTFNKAPGNKIGEYTLDANDSAVITAEFANGALGSIHTTRTAGPHINTVQLDLYGEKGTIKIDLDDDYSKLNFWSFKNAKRGKKQTILCKPEQGLYKRFIKSIRSGVNDQPDFARGAEIQKLLDACHASDATNQTVKI